MRRAIGCGIGGALALGLACSEPTAPPAAEPDATPPAAATAPATQAPATAAAPSDPALEAAPPRALTPEEAEEARRAVEAALEDVRKQIEQKAAELGAEPAPQQP